MNHVTFDTVCGCSFTNAHCLSTQPSHHERQIVRKLNGEKDIVFQTIYASQSVGNEVNAANELLEKAAEEGSVAIVTSKDLNHAVMGHAIAIGLTKGGRKPCHILLLIHQPLDTNPETSLISIQLFKLDGASKQYTATTLWENGNYIQTAAGTGR